MTSLAVRCAGEVDRAAFGGFLRRAYSPEKAAFLEQHGEWWHRGQQNRWVIEDGGDVAAYCAVIPTALRVAGHRVSAVWWVDLVVAPEFRGRGLQRAFDERVREAAPLIVGFPNALAADIHRKHGWGVREDLQVRLLPLRPGDVARGGKGKGFKKGTRKIGAVMAAPAARRFRYRLRGFEPRCSRLQERPAATILARVFLQDRQTAVVTTFRDEDYLRWRYLDAPYRDEIFVVTGGEADVVEVAAVVRVMRRGARTVARILDLFGALDQTDVVRDVLWLASKEALFRGADQVTAMSSTSVLSKLLRKAGFVVWARGRFCWTGPDANFSQFMNDPPPHLVLGDSDNDEP